MQRSVCDELLSQDILLWFRSFDIEIYIHLFGQVELYDKNKDGKLEIRELQK